MLSSKGHEAIWNLRGTMESHPIIVTKSYSVVSAEEYEDACRVTVHFNIWGYIDVKDESDEKVGLVFKEKRPAYFHVDTFSGLFSTPGNLVMHGLWDVFVGTMFYDVKGLPGR